MSAEQISIANEAFEESKTSRFLPLNIQLFADGGEGAGDTGGEGNTDGGDTGNNDNGGNDNKDNQNQQLSTEALEKLIQSRVDKLTADLGKKNSTLQKELEKLKRDKLTDEEIKKLEIADKEKALTDKEQALLERENKLYAIKAIKAAGLDDGSDKSLELIDFVMSNDETEIETRVKAFKSLVDRLVSAEVDKTFKTNGRTPNSGKGSSGGETNTIAEQLGKDRAAQNKQANDVLNYYIGGKK